MSMVYGISKITEAVEEAFHHHKTDKNLVVGEGQHQ
jgi:hypothetical protein